MDKLEGMELLIQQNLLLHDHTILLTGHRLQCSAGNNIGQCEKVHLLLQYEVCHHLKVVYVSDKTLFYIICKLCTFVHPHTPGPKM